MGITLGTLGDLKAGAFEGKNLKEAWFEGVKLWPVAGINTILNLKPSTYLPLGGDITDYSGNGNDPGATIGNIEYYTAGFNGAPCLDLIGGGAAIRLPAVVKGTNAFTISICAFSMGSSSTTYDGIMGGVLDGLGTSGLGYALGLDTANGDPSSTPMRFQIYNGSSNQVCKTDVDNWIVNGWNHLIMILDVSSNTIEFYLNGEKYGLMTPDQYPLGGPVRYDGRDYTWDGNIWLGRAFHTTVPPLDWWQGYLQEYAYFPRALTPTELNLLYRVYKGNMLPSTSKSPSIDSWGSTKPFVCTGGTGTTEDNIQPNMIAASETNKITTNKIDGFYFSRSMSPDVGVEGSLGGYSLKATVTISGITFPYNITGSMKTIKNNLDGSGAYLPANDGVFPKGDIVFEFTFQGVTQKFIVTKTT